MKKIYRIHALSKKGTAYRFRVTLNHTQSLREILSKAFPEGLIRLFTVEELKGAKA